LILLTGRGLDDGRVAGDLAYLGLYAAGALILGVLLLRRGLRHAERTGGLSVVG
jgi:hypothetical protein